MNQLIDIGVPKIGITYLVRRDHPSLKVRIPKASTGQIATFHPDVGEVRVRKVSVGAVRVIKADGRYLAVTQFCADHSCAGKCCFIVFWPQETAGRKIGLDQARKNQFGAVEGAGYFGVCEISVSKHGRTHVGGRNARGPAAARAPP